MDILTICKNIMCRQLDNDEALEKMDEQKCECTNMINILQRSIFTQHLPTKLEIQTSEILNSWIHVHCIIVLFVNINVFCCLMFIKHTNVNINLFLLFTVHHHWNSRHLLCAQKNVVRGTYYNTAIVESNGVCFMWSFYCNQATYLDLLTSLVLTPESI